MNKQKNKKKVIAFLLSMLMLISLFQNISYTPVAEGGEPERVASESDAVSVGDEQDPVEDEQAGEIQVQSYQMPQDVSMDDLRVGDAAPVFTVKDYSIKTKGPNGEYTEEITNNSTVYADQDIKLSFNWELTDGELTEGNREFIIPAENIAAAGISIPAGTRACCANAMMPEVNML